LLRQALTLPGVRCKRRSASFQGNFYRSGRRRLLRRPNRRNQGNSTMGDGAHWLLTGQR
jgi:hypothetical protein